MPTTQELDFSPRARATDPATSHAAAASVTNLTEKQNDIRNILHAFGPYTHEELIHMYRICEKRGTVQKQTDSGIRTRCSELVKLGLVEPTEETRIMSTGRKACVWRAV